MKLSLFNSLFSPPKVISSNSPATSRKPGNTRSQSPFTAVLNLALRETGKLLNQMLPQGGTAKSDANSRNDTILQLRATFTEHSTKLITPEPPKLRAASRDKVEIFSDAGGAERHSEDAVGGSDGTAPMLVGLANPGDVVTISPKPRTNEKRESVVNETSVHIALTKTRGNEESGAGTGSETITASTQSGKSPARVHESSMQRITTPSNSTAGSRVESTERAQHFSDHQVKATLNPVAGQLADTAPSTAPVMHVGSKSSPALSTHPVAPPHAVPNSTQNGRTVRVTNPPVNRLPRNGPDLANPMLRIPSQEVTSVVEKQVAIVGGTGEPQSKDGGNKNTARADLIRAGAPSQRSELTGHTTSEPVRFVADTEPKRTQISPSFSREQFSPARSKSEKPIDPVQIPEKLKEPNHQASRTAESTTEPQPQLANVRGGVGRIHLPGQPHPKADGQNADLPRIAESGSQPKTDGIVIQPEVRPVKVMADNPGLSNSAPKVDYPANAGDITQPKVNLAPPALEFSRTDKVVVTHTADGIISTGETKIARAAKQGINLVHSSHESPQINDAVAAHSHDGVISAVETKTAGVGHSGEVKPTKLSSIPAQSLTKVVITDMSTARQPSSEISIPASKADLVDRATVATTEDSTKAPRIAQITNIRETQQASPSNNPESSKSIPQRVISILERIKTVWHSIGSIHSYESHKSTAKSQIAVASVDRPATSRLGQEATVVSNSTSNLSTNPPTESSRASAAQLHVPVVTLPAKNPDRVSAPERIPTGFAPSSHAENKADAVGLDEKVSVNRTAESAPQGIPRESSVSKAQTAKSKANAKFPSNGNTNARSAEHGDAAGVDRRAVVPSAPPERSDPNSLAKAAAERSRSELSPIPGPPLAVRKQAEVKSEQHDSSGVTRTSTAPEPPSTRRSVAKNEPSSPANRPLQTASDNEYRTTSMPREIQLATDSFKLEVSSLELTPALSNENVVPSPGTRKELVDSASQKTLVGTENQNVASNVPRAATAVDSNPKTSDRLQHFVSAEELPANRVAVNPPLSSQQTQAGLASNPPHMVEHSLRLGTTAAHPHEAGQLGSRSPEIMASTSTQPITPASDSLVMDSLPMRPANPQLRAAQEIANRIIQQTGIREAVQSEVHFSWKHEELGQLRFSVTSQDSRVRVEISTASIESARILDDARMAIERVAFDQGVRIERLDVRLLPSSFGIDDQGRKGADDKLRQPDDRDTAHDARNGDSPKGEERPQIDRSTTRWRNSHEWVA